MDRSGRAHPIDKKLLCANLQPRCEVLGEIPEQLDFFDAMPDYDVSLYTNKKQKTTRRPPGRHWKPCCPC